MAEDRPGAVIRPTGTDFALWSYHATGVELCLFDGAGAVETRRIAMRRGPDATHRVFVPGIGAGVRYGFRVHGPYDPGQGHWFDPQKLLVDPYAREIDRPFVHDARLGQFGLDTAALMPKAIVTEAPGPNAPARAAGRPLPPGGLIYEINVKAFTKLHPDVPEARRGTLAALAEPAILSHLTALGVDAVELMPITAWIDERHLPPLGLVNSWGYNPVALMALDPRLVPGGLTELRETVDALHRAGIGVILDLVFNHTGESDARGTTLSLRGIDNRSFFRHVADDPATLVNDTGCGNTLACDHPVLRQLILDTLRHFALAGGVDGFRFDLAPVLGRHWDGFHRDGPTLTAILEDPLLADRVMIAEPWDIGLGGYQLGRFPGRFLEWNDRSRDAFRRFWRGDGFATGDFATALAGAADLFGLDGRTATRSVNFVAAHDGFTLADLTAYAEKHNDANGEDNRDGHGDNHSWNHGIEGPSGDKAVLAARKADCRALLSSLFLSKGWIMLTAGDEAGRSQGGNNNAYCQDNPISWIDWSRLDADLITHTATLSGLRKRFAALSDPSLWHGEGDVAWFALTGRPMTVADWQADQGPGLCLTLDSLDRDTGAMVRLAIRIRRRHVEVTTLPSPPPGRTWKALLPPAADAEQALAASVELFVAL